METDLAPRPLARDRRRVFLTILVVAVALVLIAAASIALAGNVFADPMAGT